MGVLVSGPSLGTRMPAAKLRLLPSRIPKAGSKEAAAVNPAPVKEAALIAPDGGFKAHEDGSAAAEQGMQQRDGVGDGMFEARDIPSSTMDTLPGGGVKEASVAPQRKRQQGRVGGGGCGVREDSSGAVLAAARPGGGLTEGSAAQHSKTQQKGVRGGRCGVREGSSRAVLAAARPGGGLKDGSAAAQRSKGQEGRVGGARSVGKEGSASAVPVASRMLSARSVGQEVALRVWIAHPGGAVREASASAALGIRQQEMVG
ncbi:unnamed protein product [Closterium sp. Naga37s-1]|nr:unnamed protein product [Closterium sp. Naga37s-1]